MTGYTVLANRYRPRVFAEVVGQEDVGQVLQGALREGRAAHAFLFSGPRGVGKTSMARILAKAFNCLENELGEPCGSCSVCAGIDGGSEVFDVEEIDGASHNRVENVRELIERLRFAPTVARHRITIVDEVHMLSTAAFNALLKTLEEPPAHAKFILATTEPLKVPETIRSRCQMLDFRRLTAVQIAARLEHVCVGEGVTTPEGLMARIARHAQGGLRDALTLLDQLITMGEGSPQLEHFERLTGSLSSEALQDLLVAVLRGDVGQVHAWAEDAVSCGARPSDLLAQLLDWLEGLLVSTAGGQPADRTDEEVGALAELAKATNVDHVMAMIDVVLEAQQRLRRRHDGRLVLEMALLTLARLAVLTPLSELLADPSRLADAPPAVAPCGAPPATPAAAPSRALGSGASARPATPAPAPTRAGSARPARPVRPAAPPPSAARAEPAPAEDFRSKFLGAISGRSLRLELLRYAELSVDGDRLRLVPPRDGPPLLHDPHDPKVTAQLRAAAAEAAGRPLELVLPAAPGAAPSVAAAGQPADAPAANAPSAAPMPSAAPRPPAGTPKEPAPEAAAAPAPEKTPPRRSGKGSSASSGAVDAHVRELWPEAEDVDG